MNQTLIIGLAALLAGGAGGFIIGKSGDEAKSGGVGSDETSAARVRLSASRDVESERSRKMGGRSTEDIMREPGQTARLQGLIDMYAGMDIAQLEDEAGKLDSLPMADRIMASILLFSRWAELDPQGALAYANGMGMSGMFAKPTILRSWASVDPVNAAKYYSENPDEFASMGRGRGPGGDDGAELIAREWAKLDPEAAFDWAKSLDDRSRGGAVASVIGELAATDPSRAASMAATLEGDDQVRAYGEIAEKWARTDMGAAEAWINTLSGDAKQRALSELIGVLADQDPKAAASRVASLEPGDARDRAIREVVGPWSQSNPAEAAAWLVSQESDDAGDAMRRVMGNWVSQDKPGALAFIESQPIGDLRDGATQSYLWMNRGENPSQSIALAETISDEGSRSRAVGMTAMRWMQEDEAAAKAYIEGTDAIDDQLKERILSGDLDQDRRGGGRGGR